MGQAPSYDSPLAPGKPIKAIARPTAAVPPMTQPPYKIYCTSGQASVRQSLSLQLSQLMIGYRSDLTMGGAFILLMELHAQMAIRSTTTTTAIWIAMLPLNTPYQYTAHL